MKFSLTLIFAFLMIFLSSCNSTSPINMEQKVINLNIKTGDKNKNLIIESLLKNEQKFTINFQNENAYFLENNVLNSRLNYFCKGFINDQRDILEKIIFKNKNFNEKKVLVVYLKEHENLANELKEKYPSEDYYLINEVNFETQIKTLLDIDASFSRFLTLSKLDNNIQISHTPRIKNNIASIYFLMDYENGKTIMPIFRSYAFDIDFYSSSEIFHDALDFKKLIDFEKTYIPFTKSMIETIANENNSILQEKIILALINDYVEIEKIYQHNLFRKNYKPKSGNNIVRRNNCIDRDLNLWQISSDNFNQT